MVSEVVGDTHSSAPATDVEVDGSDIDGVLDGASSPRTSHPALVHRFRHNKSILALVATDKLVYAGTQGGEILVYNLNTFERVKVIHGHGGSVLGLCLSDDYRLLFSSAGDRIVNIWETGSLKHVASIYCLYDVGDIFCVSYSNRSQTVYLGSQNTSIQWYDLKGYDTRPAPDPKLHPSLRPDRFFDSPGPGGVRLPRPQADDQVHHHAKTGRNLEIHKDHLHQFAHFGYVYSMLLAKGANLGVQAEEILISGGGDGVIKLWTLDDSDSGRIHEFGQLEDGREEGDSVLALIFDGTFLYSGRVAGEVNVWHLETRQLVRTLKAHQDDILTLSLGYGLLFSAAVNGFVKKFNQRYEAIATWKAHAGRILASTFTRSNSRDLYITGSNDDTIAIWDVGYCDVRDTPVSKPSHDKLFDSLRQFVSYRTVSADPRYKVDCRRGASYLRSVLRKFGASTEMLKTEYDSNPIVFAKFRGNPATASTRKRIMFYGHYDVIAAEDKQNRWIADPFTMEGIDGFLYGRGVSDNKGPIMAAIYAVASLISKKSLESDIIFLIEGEEENGSKGFQDAIRRNKDLIGPVDWILLANSYWLDDEVPCLTYGLRGVVHATIEIYSDEPDLHSGIDGSKLLDEPLKDLVMLLGTLTGRQGEVQLPGFYNPILPVTKHERQLYDEISQTLLQRNPDLGEADSLTASLMARWRNATLTIHGFKTSGSEKSTIIPHQAQASISLRLVPNQKASTVGGTLVAFLEHEFARLGSKNHVIIKINHQAEPWLGDYTNEIFQTLEHAVMRVWNDHSTSSHDLQPLSPVLGNASPHSGPLTNSTTTKSDAPPSLRRRSAPLSNTSTSLTSHNTAPATSSTLAGSSSASNSPVVHAAVGPDIQSLPNPSVTQRRKPLYIREGGSIPAIKFLETQFQAPAAHLPCGQASDNAHLDNERLRVLNLLNSRRIFEEVFLELPRK